MQKYLQLPPRIPPNPKVIIIDQTVIPGQFEEMPDDAIGIIISYLDIVGVEAFSYTCKKVNKVANTEQVCMDWLRNKFHIKKEDCFVGDFSESLRYFLENHCFFCGHETEEQYASYDFGTVYKIDMSTAKLLACGKCSFNKKMWYKKDQVNLFAELKNFNMRSITSATHGSLYHIDDIRRKEHSQKWRHICKKNKMASCTRKREKKLFIEREIIRNSYTQKKIDKRIKVLLGRYRI